MSVYPPSIREEMRVLGEVAEESVGAVNTNDWFTPEFWAMVVSAATNLVTVGVVLGWLSSTDAATLTKALSALLGAAQVILLNSALVWKFISARTQVKEAALTAKYQYMTAAMELQRLRQQGGGA